MASVIGWSFCAVLVAHLLLVLPLCTRRRTDGYVWRAHWACRYLLLSVLVARALIIIAAVALIIHEGASWAATWAGSFLLALLIASIPESLESLATEALPIKTARAVFLILGRPNISSLQIVLRCIQQLRERDNYDCQKQRGKWNFNVAPDVVGRRIRILYEERKFELANWKRRPELLEFDKGVSPWQKFYLLVDYLGPHDLRERLRALSMEGSDPNGKRGDDWDGRERRRSDSVDTGARRRLGDNDDIRRLVAQGKASPSLLEDSESAALDVDD